MCVACMDGKIADRKGYEFVRKITETLTSSDSKKCKILFSFFHIFSFLLFLFF